MIVAAKIHLTVLRLETFQNIYKLPRNNYLYKYGFYKHYFEMLLKVVTRLEKHLALKNAGIKVKLP